ncbi:MAG: hypothetical protein Q8L27_04085 [archaeon]|nr:hypothetical protein [archaeon]
MATITLAVPDDIRKKMKEFPDISWSEVARQAIIKKVEILERFTEFSKKSSLTEDDAITLGRELNKRIAKRHKWSS